MENRKRTVLVVEDNELNREILAEILSEEYNVLKAENGKEGLEVFKENLGIISLILLDIQMPVMNGYEFLDAIKDKPEYAGVPIIVTTSSSTLKDELQCLENGASDFVPKPYNTDVVLRRVESMIRLSESSSMIERLEHDILTGLFSRTAFFIKSDDLLRQSSDEFDIFYIDIVSYDDIKDRYSAAGTEKALLCVAEEIEKLMPDGSLCGRLDDHGFAVLSKHKSREYYENVAQQVRLAVKKLDMPNASVHFSLYHTVEHDVLTENLCNDALWAMNGIEHQYGKQIAAYTAELKQQKERKQVVLNLMEKALEQEQFQVYYQPKFSLEKDRIQGAEALIRWISPELGFMSPGEFIPLFEQSGFITDIDLFVANKVCRDLRQWIDEGKNAVSISFNLSRTDFNNPELSEIIIKTAEKYDIPKELIHLEVTESAYSDNMDHVLAEVKRLNDCGFPIELDDFGSGYSSYSILYDMAINYLKIDRSLIRNLDSEKQLIILNHIFAVAKSLGMKLVAEGTETEEQIAKLKEMGCDFAQGYFYSKPLPKEQFEEYLVKE